MVSTPAPVPPTGVLFLPLRIKDRRRESFAPTSRRASSNEASAGPACLNPLSSSWLSWMLPTPMLRPAGEEAGARGAAGPPAPLRGGGGGGGGDPGVSGSPGDLRGDLWGDLPKRLGDVLVGDVLGDPRMGGRDPLRWSAAADDISMGTGLPRGFLPPHPPQERPPAAPSWRYTSEYGEYAPWG